MRMPIGVIVYCHEDIPAERVPYMSEAELVEAFSGAVEDGFPQEKLFPYVRADRPDIADKLVHLMRGERYPVYQLTEENLSVVLGDYRVVIPAGQKA